MTNSVHFLGLSGSLRKASYNTALLHNIANELLPEDTSMEIFSLDDIPLYNEDLDEPNVLYRPVQVQLLRKAIEKAEGIVICSPEYNYGIPGLLKNAIDWASRGADSPLLHKPISVMGATIHSCGTIHMQSSFLSIFQYLQMKPVYKPEVLISQAKNKFDSSGKLTDSATRKLVKQQLQALKLSVMNERISKEMSV